jgi:hypothetical protein
MAKIVVETDPKLQAWYYCFVAQDVASGDYAKGDYLVLPYLVTHPKTIYFPPISLPREFWAYFSLGKITDYHQPFPDSQTSSITTLLLPTQTQITKFSSQLNSLTIPVKLTKNIKTIYILPTLFGTRGSFNYQRKSNKNDVFISHRLDFPITNILTTLTHVQLTIQLNCKTEVGEIAWWRRQSIGDYLTGNLTTPRFSQSDLLASQKYLSGLGLSNNHLHLEKVKNSLSSQELRLWQALEDKSGQMLTFEEAGDSIWADCSSFSLYSLAKIVESIRKKMTTLGFNPRLLKTIRKRGYYLG